MPASASPPTASELRERAEALLEHVRDTTPESDPWSRLREAHEELLREFALDAEERPRLTLIQGGRDDAS